MMRGVASVQSTLSSFGRRCQLPCMRTMSAALIDPGNCLRRGGGEKDPHIVVHASSPALSSRSHQRLRNIAGLESSRDNSHT